MSSPVNGRRINASSPSSLDAHGVVPPAPALIQFVVLVHVPVHSLITEDTCELEPEVSTVPV